MGGLGLTPQLVVAPFAFAASSAAAFRRLRRGPAQNNAPQPPTQEAATQAFHKELRERFLQQNPGLTKHLGECSEKGAASWLTAARFSFSGAGFAAALRYRLRAPPAGQPSLLSCPGCRAEFPEEGFDEHAAGCARVAGMNATKKHNAIVQFLCALCDKAGLNHAAEPRDLQAFVCKRCGANVVAQRRPEHERACSNRFARTGPDLRIHWPDGQSVVYDVTVAHTTAPSFRNERPSKITKDKTEKKKKFYAPILGNEPFVVLAARALGYIEKPFRKLVKELCEIAEISPRDALEELSVVLARGVGLSLVEARRPHRHV